MDKSILQNATLPTPEPTPGWLYPQIDAMTNASVEACTSVENWLMKRLQEDSPHIKRKVLLVIKHSAESGHQDFCRAIQRRSEEIRKYANFRGPQDPLVGDSVNQAVRDAAQDALAAIFNRGTMTNSAMGRATATTKMTGFGSDSFNNNNNNSNNNNGNSQRGPMGGGQPITGFGSGDKPSGGIASQGFGNPAFASNNTAAKTGSTQTWGEWAISKVPFVGTGAPAKPFTADPDQYATFLEYQNESFAPPQINNGSSYPAGGNSTYNGGNNTYNSGGGNSSSPSGGYSNPTTYPNASNNTNRESSAPRFPREERLPGQPAGGWQGQEQPSRPKASDSSGTLEAKIVDEITSTSGVRALPQRQDLAKFVSRCATANSHIVATIVDEKLCSQIWQIKLKSLYVVEALIKAKNAEVTDYFTTNSENIEECTLSVQASVADKASKILRLLNKAAPVPSAQQLAAREQYMASASAEERAAATTTTTSSADTNFLDFTMDSNPSQPAARKTSNAEVGMFDGLDVKDSQPLTSPSAVATTAGSSSSSSTSNNDILNMFLAPSTVTPTTAQPTSMQMQMQMQPMQPMQMQSMPMQMQPMMQPMQLQSMPVGVPMQMGMQMPVGAQMVYYPTGVPAQSMPMYWVPAHGAPPAVAMRPVAPAPVVQQQQQQQAASPAGASTPSPKNSSSFSFMNPRSSTPPGSRPTPANTTGDPFDFVRASMTVSK